MSGEHAIEDLAQLPRLLEAIEARYGFDFRHYSMASLERRVATFASKYGLTALAPLQEKLLVEPVFFAAFLDHVMIGVTEFFRDPAFFLKFRQVVIPVLRTYPRIRIWNAGCSSGEEVYSIAILLHEEGLYDRTQIYGTDLSPQSVERAKEGVYPARQIRQFTENHQKSGGTESFSNYYRAAYEHFVIAESLKKNIVFFQHDLVADQIFGEMHAVFCRNVLIYFSPELKIRVVDKLAGALCRGGFLCLGSSEAIPPQSDGRIVELAVRERIFRRTDS